MKNRTKNKKLKIAAYVKLTCLCHQGGHQNRQHLANFQLKYNPTEPHLLTAPWWSDGTLHLIQLASSFCMRPLYKAGFREEKKNTK